MDQSLKGVALTGSAINAAKQAVREKVWASLKQEQAALPPGAVGQIPNFVGAQLAAQRLTDTDAWQRSRVVKSNPDWAQLPARIKALEERKLLYMAVPKLAALKPFYFLDPATISQPFETIATGKGAAMHAKTIGVETMQPVDLVIAGSVAVNLAGVRIGKGAGYSDIEVALLAEAGLIGPDTVIATTVHSLQVLDQELPETEHDFSVDLIVTPGELIHCGNPRRPTGLSRHALTAEQINSIPVLRLSE